MRKAGRIAEAGGLKNFCQAIDEI